MRQPVFKEAVQLKLDGLPAGVTLAAPPMAVAGDKSDFEIQCEGGCQGGASDWVPEPDGVDDVGGGAVCPASGDIAGGGGEVRLRERRPG